VRQEDDRVGWMVETAELMKVGGLGGLQGAID